MIKRIITFSLVLALLAGHLTTPAYAGWMRLALQREAMQNNSADGQEDSTPELTYEDILEARKNRQAARQATAQEQQQAPARILQHATAQVQQSDIQGKWEFSIDMKNVLKGAIFDKLQENFVQYFISTPLEHLLSLPTDYWDPVELKGTVFFKQNGDYEISISKEQEKAYYNSMEKMARKTYRFALPYIMADIMQVKNPLEADSWKNAIGESFEEFWEESTGDSLDTSAKTFANAFVESWHLDAVHPGKYKVQSDKTNKLFYSHSSSEPLTEKSAYFTFKLDGDTVTITDCSEKEFYINRFGNYFIQLFPFKAKKTA